MARPDITETTLGRVAREALIEDGYAEGMASELVDDMWLAGAFEALEEHIRKEIESPTLKGPNLGWRLKHVLGR